MMNHPARNIRKTGILFLYIYERGVIKNLKKSLVQKYIRNPTISENPTMPVVINKF